MEDIKVYGKSLFFLFVGNINNNISGFYYVFFYNI